MKNKWHASMILALIGLVASILACNAPTPTPQAPSPLVAPDTPTVPPQETPLPSPTQAPPTATSTSPPPATTQAAPTSTPQATTETPTPTETKPPKTVRPTPAPPVSSGPLDFAVPAELDNWRSLPDDGFEVTIILHITGGAPPYTVHHDVDVFTTEKTNPAIVFTAQGCTALVHTIIVESADGQRVTHDYWIAPPWCK